ncbi:hypothetical protein NL676_000833 [Syzygium grande]|nr:hypothetical protein NL676_000833 [Syzygium grande]
MVGVTVARPSWLRQGSRQGWLLHDGGTQQWGYSRSELRSWTPTGLLDSHLRQWYRDTKTGHRVRSSSSNDNRRWPVSKQQRWPEAGEVTATKEFPPCSA